MTANAGQTNVEERHPVVRVLRCPLCEDPHECRAEPGFKKHYWYCDGCYARIQVEPA